MTEKCELHSHDSACGCCCTMIRNVGVTAGRETLIHDISFELHCGELVVLIGRNGAGKTTLLRALLGEIKHTGDIEFYGKDGEKRPLSIGYVPQKLSIDSNSPVSVYDFCASYTSRRPVFLPANKKLKAQIIKHLDEFGVGALANRRICQLSGGELQRVLLAVATLRMPELLILDEPAAGIDRNGMADFYNKLNELKKEQDLAVLLVSHDFGYLKQCADRLILLDKTVLCDGSYSDVVASDVFRDVFPAFSAMEGGAL